MELFNQSDYEKKLIKHKFGRRLKELKYLITDKFELEKLLQEFISELKETDEDIEKIADSIGNDLLGISQTQMGIPIVVFFKKFKDLLSQKPTTKDFEASLVTEYTSEDLSLPWEIIPTNLEAVIAMAKEAETHKFSPVIRIEYQGEPIYIRPSTEGFYLKEFEDSPEVILDAERLSVSGTFVEMPTTNGIDTVLSDEIRRTGLGLLVKPNDPDLEKRHDNLCNINDVLIQTSFALYTEHKRKKNTIKDYPDDNPITYTMGTITSISCSGNFSLGRD